MNGKQRIAVDGAGPGGGGGGLTVGEKAFGNGPTGRHPHRRCGFCKSQVLVEYIDCVTTSLDVHRPIELFWLHFPWSLILQLEKKFLIMEDLKKATEDVFNYRMTALHALIITTIKIVIWLEN